MSRHLVERRSESRLAGPFVSVMFRRTTDGRQAEHALAEEISGRAVRLRLFRESVRAGDRVFALMHLTILTEGHGPRVAIRGRVLRLDRRPGGLVAAVVMLTRHRWLFADAVISEVTRSGGGVDGSRPPHKRNMGRKLGEQQ